MILPLVIAAALSAGNAEFDATAANGAMDIAMAKEVARLSAEGPSKDALKTKMLADPDTYSTTEKAKAKSKADYAELVLAELLDAQMKAAERLGIRSEEVAARMDAAQLQLDATFERRFAEERKAACDEQAKKIAANVKPSESDFGRKSEADIRAELEGAVIGQQRAAVFEENKKYISEQIVGPIIDSAKKELNRQREYLKRTRCDAYAPSALEKELASNLGRNVDEHNAKNANDAIKWGVFPVVVEQSAKEVAEKRTLDRVSHAIDDVEMKVDAALIRSKIVADREKHRKASDSEQSFGKIFAGLLTGKALDKTIADAPEAEREEFREFVMAHAGEASLGKAVEARVKRELVPQVREVRGEIAAEDAEKLWPTLMDGTWYPEGSLADAVCARSDYSKAVKRWRDSPELVQFAKAGNGQVLIEETEKLADGKVAKAFDRARSAINAQNAALDRVVPEVIVEAKNRKGEWFSKTPDLDKIVELLSAGVTAKWNETHDEVLWGGEEKPKNAAEQHRELFPSVKRRIELEAKKVLEEMEKSDSLEIKIVQEKQKPLPGDIPGEVPPEETPPEETPQEEMLTIIVKKNGDRVEAKIRKGQSSFFNDSCPAKKDDLHTMFNAFADALEKAMELK